MTSDSPYLLVCSHLYCEGKRGRRQAGRRRRVVWEYMGTDGAGRTGGTGRKESERKMGEE